MYIPCKTLGDEHTSTTSSLNVLTKQWYSTPLQFSIPWMAEQFFFLAASSHSDLLAGHLRTTSLVSEDSVHVSACTKFWKINTLYYMKFI